ncbi:MAG: DUF2007 domain-containing protein [Pseudomonadota bacterium]
MKKLTTHSSLITISHYKNLLEAEGIAAEIRNQHLGSVLGDIPFPEVWPELWVLNDLDYDRGQQLIAESLVDESPRQAWRCRQCGEENEGQFGACWNCGATLETLV